MAPFLASCIENVFISHKLPLSTLPCSMLRRLSATSTTLRAPTSTFHPVYLQKHRNILQRFTTTNKRAFSTSKFVAMAQKSGEKYTNRLSNERSPYLLQHAHNPVDWYPWGEEAFSKARIEDKPIFLSIGYSTCHWCHVMEVESFESDEVAKLLNDWFVSIKVDREERPDVDKVYMTYVQVIYGGGGWPLSVFLTPELKPIVGGTYFPPDDKFGRPGFKTVLRHVKEAWDSKKDLLCESGNNAIQQLGDALYISVTSTKLEKSLQEQAVELCAEEFAQSFDSELGGFGSAPKFPRPVEIMLMLRQHKKLQNKKKVDDASKVLEMVLFTLQCMARGGMHDHLGGGFHRYSVDEYWHVPHFEKMLYDQGQLVNVYLDAFCISKDTMYSSVARDTLDYLRRDMTDPDGGIYSAEDADSAESDVITKKREGAFYVWTNHEIEEDIGLEHSKLFMSHYYVKPEGNCDLSRMSDPHKEFQGKNVLIEREEMKKLAEKAGLSLLEYAEVLAACREQLFLRRVSRPRPHLDDKVIVGWNGLAISAFARASRILKAEPSGTRYFFPVAGCHPMDYLASAEKAANFINSILYDKNTHRLIHSYRQGPSQIPGFLDDYAFLINGLLDLYEAGGQTKWLKWAIELQSSQDELFLDKIGGGYFNTPAEDPSILLRLKEDYDGAEPSGNSVSAVNLLRLSSFIFGNLSDSYRQTAEHLMTVFEKRIKQQPIAVPLLCCAADLLASQAKKQIVIVGNKSTPSFDSLVDACFGVYELDKTVIQIDLSSEDDSKFWQLNNSMVFSMAEKSPKTEAVAYVCQNFSCQAPVSDPDALNQLLQQS